MNTQNDLTRRDLVKLSAQNQNPHRMIRLTGAVIENVNFDNLDLHGFLFMHCKLAGSTFRNTILRNTSFEGADVTDCDFTDAVGLTHDMFLHATSDRVIHNTTI
jgi:uncharacterized protein YjbI with pentapeptide repeats